MKCNGKCYCGNSCLIDHEVEAKRCSCDNHNICKNKCEECYNNCCYIAHHKTIYGGCKCIMCNFWKFNK